VRPDGASRFGHVAGPNGVNGIGEVDLGLAGIHGGDGTTMEHQFGPELSVYRLHGVAVIDPHVADVGGQDLVGQARQRAFGGQQITAPASNGYPPGQRVLQITPELTVGTGHQNSHGRGRRQPAEPQPPSTTGARARNGSHHSRLSAYHSTVSASPSSQEIWGAQPSSERSLVESSR
jgi:hypothetical protein